MGQITVEKNLEGIEGLCLIKPAVHGDSRGYFMETYSQRDMAEAGLDITFVQDNQSMSTKGVLRGLHFQKQYPQTKLVRVIRGEVFDVAVDIRPGSKTWPNSATSATTSIIPTTRAAWPGTTRISGSNGRSCKEHIQDQRRRKDTRWMESH